MIAWFVAMAEYHDRLKREMRRVPDQVELERPIDPTFRLLISKLAATRSRVGAAAIQHNDPRRRARELHTALGDLAHALAVISSILKATEIERQAR